MAKDKKKLTEGSGTNGFKRSVLIVLIIFIALTMSGVFSLAGV